jgi:hypothetical protein
MVGGVDADRVCAPALLDVECKTIEARATLVTTHVSALGWRTWFLSPATRVDRSVFSESIYGRAPL